MPIYINGQFLNEGDVIHVPREEFAAPTITTQPVGATINAGATHDLTVVAASNLPHDPALTYQWYRGVLGDGTDWVAITDATAATYTYTGISGDPAGLNFVCNVYDSRMQIAQTTVATMVVNIPAIWEYVDASSFETSGTTTFAAGQFNQAAPVGSAFDVVPFALTAPLAVTPGATYRIQGQLKSVYSGRQNAAMIQALDGIPVNWQLPVDPALYNVVGAGNTVTIDVAWVPVAGKTQLGFTVTAMTSAQNFEWISLKVVAG